MAKFVLKTPVIMVGAFDISDHVSQVTIETSRDEVDVTAFGATHKETLAGLGDATITMDVFQDFAASEVDVTLQPLSVSDTPFTVSVKPATGATSATNPLYSMSSLLFEYSPIAGSVGEASTTSITFKNAAQTGLTRATA